jgi:hypothetical protein
VNGGTYLSAAEKQELDVWYIRNASPWIDLRIVWMTMVSLVRGDRRSEQALAQARRDWHTSRISVDGDDPRLHQGAPRHGAAVTPNPKLKEDGATSAVRTS